MELIGTYQIDDLTVVNPTIQIRQVNDNIVDKTCSIEVIFNVEGAIINYSRNISGFTYLITWDDLDIENFIVEKMEELRIDAPNNLRKTRLVEEKDTISEIQGKEIEKSTSLFKKIIQWMKSKF